MSIRNKNIVFLMDPLESVRPHHDTSYALMCEYQTLGNHIYYLPKNGLTLKNGALECHVTPVICTPKKKTPFIVSEAVVINENQIDTLWIRTDPPFDIDYLRHMHLLDSLSHKIPVFNHPNGIRSVHEKIWCTKFRDITPMTTITQHKEVFLNFLKEHKRIVMKPTDGFGGQGIFIVDEGSLNQFVSFELLTENETKPVILQPYIRAADKGDKRILLVNGEPIGAVLRVHKQGDHRNNLFAGGRFEKTDITSNDKKIIATIKKELQELKLGFVGIDIIDDMLIEVNVTSPTCLQEMSALNNENLAKRVINDLHMH